MTKIKTETKPPVAVEVIDLNNFSRLALALSDSTQMLWSMPYKDKHVICIFTAYMYWDGDIPILAYVNEKKSKEPFLAYKSNSQKGEEYIFTDGADDSRYTYGSFINIKKIPDLFQESLNGNYPIPQKPLLVEVDDLVSLIRILLPLSMREDAVFPLWQFPRKDTHIIGICVPFEHYYEADAIPIFFYINQQKPLDSPFVRYSTSKSFGEKTEYANDTSDSKFFYAKIINVKDFPIFP